MTTAQGLIDSYKTGLIITSVNTQPAKPPEQVKSAFDDAIKAREDKERLENKAQAYANEVIPQARGEAARQVADAKAYKDRVIAEAEGESSRFTSVLKEYQRAPKVTRERLYLDALETVLGQSSKVMLDVKDSNSLMYIPLDKMIQQGDDENSPPVMPSAASSSAASMPTRSRPRENPRGRSIR
jgi:membrane protease subunit HflK